jgi:hypothetical protein
MVISPEVILAISSLISVGCAIAGTVYSSRRTVRKDMLDEMRVTITHQAAEIKVLKENCDDLFEKLRLERAYFEEERAKLLAEIGRLRDELRKFDGFSTLSEGK